ncbi:hypothetical protein [Rhizobium leguminosarum]
MTLAAYHASGLVLVPVKPEYFATIGSGRKDSVRLSEKSKREGMS